jgi:hypothetical protein
MGQQEQLLTLGKNATKHIFHSNRNVMQTSFQSQSPISSNSTLASEIQLTIELKAASMKASLMVRGSSITQRQRNSEAVPATHSTQLTSFGVLKEQLAIRRAFMQLYRSELARWWESLKECLMTVEQAMTLFLNLMKTTHKWARLTQIVSLFYSWIRTQKIQTSWSNLTIVIHKKTCFCACNLTMEQLIFAEDKIFHPRASS